MPHTGSSGTARAMSTARLASVRRAAGAKSVDETKAWRWPTNTRRPRSRPSLLSSFSRLPMRWATEIELAVDVERVGRIGAGGFRPFQQVGEQVGVRRSSPGRLFLRGAVFFALAMTALLRANRPCRRDQPTSPGVGDAGPGFGDRGIDKADRAFAMAALVGRSLDQLARAACSEPRAACMLGWAAMATQAPAIAPTVRPVSRIAVGDLEKSEA